MAVQRVRLSRWAVRIIELAMRALPRGEIRHRYERELTAELYALDLRAQRAFAARVLLTSTSLRAAVHASGIHGGNVMTVTTRRKPLLCRLGLKHHWVWKYTDTSDRYLICSRCGKEGPQVSAQAVNGAIISGIVSGTSPQ